MKKNQLILLGVRSLPVRERGLKLIDDPVKGREEASLPVRERGLKLDARGYLVQFLRVAPRAGAWIETMIRSQT